MKDMTPEQKTRYRMNLAIEEVISTEHEYFNDLRVIVDVRLLLHILFLTNPLLTGRFLQVYVNPLKENQKDDSQPVKILTKMEMQSIFGKIEQIYQVTSDFVK